MRTRCEQQPARTQASPAAGTPPRASRSGGPPSAFHEYLRRANDGRGRTFFFVAYEHEHALDSTLIDALVPSSRIRVSSPATDDARGASLRSSRRPRRTRPPNSRPSSNASRRRCALTASPRASTTTTTTGAQRHVPPINSDARRTCDSSAAACASRKRCKAARRDTDALAYTDNFVFSATLVNQLRAQCSRLRPATCASGYASRRAHHHRRPARASDAQTVRARSSPALRPRGATERARRASSFRTR